MLAYECGWLLRCLAYYTLPWARLCDAIALRIALRCERLRLHSWFMSATLFSCFVLLHFAVAANLLQGIYTSWGLATPCVCAAFEQTSRHEMSILIFRTGNLLIDTLAFVKAAVFTLYTGVLLVAEIAEYVWTWPRSCGCLIVMFTFSRIVIQ